MKLYNMNLSNFATKSRIVIYEKGVNIEMAPIPGAGPSSPEYKKINPLGKIPTLDADGTIIAESEKEAREQFAREMAEVGDWSEIKEIDYVCQVGLKKVLGQG